MLHITIYLILTNGIFKSSPLMQRSSNYSSPLAPRLFDKYHLSPTIFVIITDFLWTFFHFCVNDLEVNDNRNTSKSSLIQILPLPSKSTASNILTSGNTIKPLHRNMSYLHRRYRTGLNSTFLTSLEEAAQRKKVHMKCQTLLSKVEARPEPKRRDEKRNERREEKRNERSATVR